MDMDQPTDPESITHGDEIIEEPVQTQTPRRSTRVRTVPEKYGFLVDQDKDVTILESNEPVSYDEILKSSESELWLKAMKSEMDSMYKSSLELDRSWYIHFIGTIKEIDFSQNEDEPCVYKKVSGSAIVFLMLYVDYILIIGNDISILQSVKI